MPAKAFSAADIKYKRVKTIPVDLGDADNPILIDITFSPDKWTRQFIAETEAPKDDGEPVDNFERTFRVFSGLVTGWSLTDPLTPEVIDSLGFLIQNTINLAIMKEINGGDATDPKEPLDA